MTISSSSSSPTPERPTSGSSCSSDSTTPLLPPSLKLLHLAKALPGALAKLATNGQSRQPRHLALLDRKLLDVAAGRIKRLAIFMPPRHGKSERVSRFFPAWYLGNFPERRIILASYEADFAASWGAKARDVISDLGRSVFKVWLRPSTLAANRWEIARHGGGMMTAGVGGPVTGKGANVFILDDPVKNAEEANSKAMRERAWDWWRSTAYTRLEPNGAVILMMTRWHEDDLAGRILADAAAGGEPWDVVRLPAIAEEGDAIGRAIGDPLWAERYDVKALGEIKRTVGGYWWSAMYQQRPAPADGGLFKRAWFRTWTETGERVARLGEGKVVSLDGLRRFSTVDLAASTRETADYTVIATWGATPEGDLLLLDLVRARLEGPDIVPALKRAHERWQPGFLAIEKVGFQLALIQLARREGLPIRELVPDRDRVSRALPATAALEAGRVFFPKGVHWLDDLESELLAFPNGVHDDMVDALSYAVHVQTSMLGFCSARLALPAPETSLVVEPDDRDDPPRGRIARLFDGFSPIRRFHRN